MKGKKVKMQIWDTAGQERFRTITCNYYNNAHGILIVYDITDKESFNAVKEWIAEIDKYGKKNVVKILVGNKVDLEDKREVQTKEGQNLADFYKIDFFETSAKKSLKIDDCFKKITE